MRAASTPRQIAGDVIQSLAKLTAEIPALKRRRWPSGHPTGRHNFSEALRVAHLTEKRMPRLPSARHPEWLAISNAAWYCGEVMARARAGDTAAAWRAAAEASYWAGAAQGILSPEAIKLKAQERAREQNKIRYRGARNSAVARAARNAARDQKIYKVYSDGLKPKGICKKLGISESLSISQIRKIIAVQKLKRASA